VLQAATFSEGEASAPRTYALASKAGVFLSNIA